jgi:hypothetical protein
MRQIMINQTHLGRLTARVASDTEEIKGLERLLVAEHYLGTTPSVGDFLWQVIEAEGIVAAVLVWGAAAYRLKDRDAWIGWPGVLREQRLKLIVQNRRFLVPEAARLPNLASAALGAAVRALPRQWRERFGYTPLLLETFVDVERYRGTCYKAAGWLQMGLTAGFARVRSDYYYAAHDRSKQLWLRPLGEAEAVRRALCAPQLAPEHEKAQILPLGGRIAVRMGQLDSLHRAFRGVPDPRNGGFRFQLASILSIIALGLLEGCVHISDIMRVAWRLNQRQREALYLPCKSGTKFRAVPSVDVLYDLLKRIDPEALASVLTEWIAAERGNLPTALAMDGKAVRDRVGLVTLCDHDDGTPVAAAVCSGKGDELKRSQDLLGRLPQGRLDGITVTADALHCQARTAELLVQHHGAEFVLQLKGNQPGVLERAKELVSADELRDKPTPFLPKPMANTAGSNTVGPVP